MLCVNDRLCQFCSRWLHALYEEAAREVEMDIYIRRGCNRRLLDLHLQGSRMAILMMARLMYYEAQCTPPVTVVQNSRTTYLSSLTH